jgi:hypothetical protein
MHTAPIDSLCLWSKQAEISEILYSVYGLRIVISRMEDTESFMDVFFQYPRAFQVMDEGDMLAFWRECQYESGHLIFRELDGGWVSRVEGSFFQTTMAVGMPPYEEYLIATPMLCVSIISPAAPLLRVFSASSHVGWANRSIVCPPRTLG